MTSCDICVEIFNQTTRKAIECPSCRLCVCAECVERFCETQQDSIEINCMKCKRAWDYEFLVKISRSFVTRQKARVEKTLVERERVKLPDTQLYLQYDRAIETHVRDEIKQATQRVFKLTEEIHDLVDSTAESMSLVEISNKYYDLSKDIRRSKRHIYRLNQHVENWKYSLRMTYTKYIPESLLQTQKATNKKSAHVCPCSVEGCNGFVMADDMACGTCFTNYCKECNQPRTEEGHACDPQDVASAREISQSSKPCPTCAVRIQKIEGCDQMWCTQCKTAFSWITGNVEHNAVHNPHFFEWFANNHRDPDRDSPETCEEGLHNRRPNQTHLLTHCSVLFGLDTDLYRHFTELFRLSVHVQYMEIDQHFSRTDLERDHLDLRLRWLKKDITLARLGYVLYKRHKEVLVNVRRRQVLQVFVTASNDIFYRLMYHCKNEADALTLRKESRALIEYVNQCFEELHDAYRMKMPVIRFRVSNGEFETCGFMGYLPMTNVFS